MLTFNFNPFPTLTTERLVLRQVTINDANEYFVFRSSERLMAYIKKKRASSIEDAYEFIKKIETALQTNEGITWGITLKNDTRVIGSIGFWRTIPDHHRAEIGYLLHHDHHGKGIMHEALEAVLKYGFNTMQLHSVEAQVHPDNKSSIKLLEKNNFVREGYFKENFCFEDHFYDTAVYSLINPDHAGV